MEFVFCNFPEQSPAAGTLRLAPVAANGLRRDRALLACEQGPDAFLHGKKPLARMELPLDPTLDDMLAAEILVLSTRGEMLPSGLKAFALYTQLVRDGLRPGEWPLESSLEGIYAAVRSSVPGHFAEPASRDAFLSAWQRISQRVVKAAADGADPFTAKLFEGDEFACERTCLARDHEAYRRDVKRGEQWQVQIPGGPSRASALLLRHPKSQFYRHFSREDRDTPTEEPYSFLAVNGGPGDWTFSTDPVQRISLQPLAESLQAAEAQRDAARAATDPWVSSAPQGHTLVASPKGKSKLPDPQIETLVKQWMFAKPVQPAVTPRRAVLAAIATTAAAALGWASLHGPRRDATRRGADPDLDDVQVTAPNLAELGPRNDYALLIATDHYDHWPRLYNPIFDATTLEGILKEQFGFQTEVVKDPTYREFLTELAIWQNKEFRPFDQLFVFIAGHGDFKENSKEGFVVLKDSKIPLEDPERQTCVDHGRLERIIKSIPCNHLFVMLDVCFGGTFDFAIAMSEPPKRGSEARGVPTNVFIRRVLEQNCRRYLTSGGKKPVSDGREGEHSPFAKGLIDVFEASKAGNEEVLTLAQLSYFAKWNDMAPCYGKIDERDQPGGDFLFVRKRAGSVGEE